MYIRHADTQTDIPIKLKYYKKIPRLAIMTLRKQVGTSVSLQLLAFILHLFFSFMEAKQT